MNWSPEAGLNCLIGPGDSTKTTILDAIQLALNPRSNFIGDDADFYNHNYELPVTITLTLVQIPNEFCTDTRYGLRLRGWDAANKVVVDEPGPGLEDALSVRVVIEPESLEGRWSIFNERLSDDADAPSLRYKDARELSTTRLGPYAERHLGWGRFSVLNRLGEGGSMNTQLALAGRAAREAFRTSNKDVFAAATARAEKLGRYFSVTVRDKYTAELDVQGSVITAGGVALHDNKLPLRTLGTGSSRLIVSALQHDTHAGVDALRRRLKDQGVPSNCYRLDTIGGWCLRYAASFPKRSGLTLREPKTDVDWRAIYLAAAKLVGSGAVDRVLAASYTGVFVDEYQDCGAEQHAVMVCLATHLPVCVLGDHLQAIFDFKDQTPVDWKADVFPAFPEATRLTKPWRWHKAGNTCLGNWLEDVRTALDEGRELDLRSSPDCVTWDWLPDLDGPRRGKIIRTCKFAMALDGRLVVIADPTNLEGRAQIAKSLAKQGFSNIEPLDCKSLFGSAKKIETASDATRLQAALDFLVKCMIGVNRSDFKTAVASRKAGGKKGTTKFGELIDLGVALEGPGGERYLLELFKEFERRSNTYVFRREMFSAMRSGLKAYLAGQSESLVDALWHAQNRVRHAGRVIARRSVGSTLLVKGLEFEHAIVVHSPNMNRKDWYVALTRATQSVTVLSPQQRFRLSD